MADIIQNFLDGCAQLLSVGRYTEVKSLCEDFLKSKEDGQVRTMLLKAEKALNQADAAIGNPYKAGSLAAYAMLNALTFGNFEKTKAGAYGLIQWFDRHGYRLADAGEYKDFLNQLLQTLEKPKLTMNDFYPFRNALVKTLQGLLHSIEVVLNIDTALLSDIGTEFFPYADRVENEKNGLLFLANSTIRLLLTRADDVEAQAKLQGKADIVRTAEVIRAVADFCYQIQNSEYSRLHLQGKLESLKYHNKYTSILISGSSYGMVGCAEGLMPRKAVNACANAQDAYYSFLTVKQALANTNKIDTVVLVGGYQFWHTDMSDDPNPFLKECLIGMNYPIFKDLRHYEGDIPQRTGHVYVDPVLETLFDFQKRYEKRCAERSAKLGKLDWFNKEYQPRPANGLLAYQFREKDDETNYEAAKKRAAAHNVMYSIAHLEDNLKEFEGLMNFLGNKVKVIVVMPPFTKYYRSALLPELTASTTDALTSLQEKLKFQFVDLSDSPLFDDTDFQDYDHLNSKGAEKLSKYLGELV